MRMTLIGLFMLVVATDAHPADSGNTFVSNDYGISIEAPATQDITAPNNKIVEFSLPPSDNFSANVSVIVLRQRSGDSLEAQDKRTMGQIQQFKLTVLNRTPKGNEIRYEYKGDMQGRIIHWYARTVKAGQLIYLVTATALDSQWAKQKTALIKSVESFSVKQSTK